MSNGMDREILLILQQLTSETTEVKTEIKYMSNLMKDNHSKIENLEGELKKAEERLEVKVEELEDKISKVKEAFDIRITNYEKFQFRSVVTIMSFIGVISLVATVLKFGEQLLKLIG